MLHVYYKAIGGLFTKEISGIPNYLKFILNVLILLDIYHVILNVCLVCILR